MQARKAGEQRASSLDGFVTPESYSYTADSFRAVNDLGCPCSIAQVRGSIVLVTEWS
jgi:hypothetical protein